MPNFHKRLLASLLVAVAAVANAQGDPFPSKPITMVNPYAAGGPADILGRELAKRLGDVLGQQVIVDNRPGGGASVGAAFVARAPADGYTLLMGTAAAHTVTPLATKVPYDGIKDFEFVGMIANVPNILTINPGVKAGTLKEFIALVKPQPGKLSYASAGMGSSPHIAFEMFKHTAGISLVHIPYRGAAPATTDMVAGTVQAGMLNVSVVVPFIKDGRLKALAYGGAKRSPELPDVPTFAEAGLKGMETGSWYSLAAPAKTPAAVVERLAQALEKVKASPEFRAALDRQNSELMPQMRAQAKDFAALDGKRLAQLVKDTGMKLQE
ncbi:MAG: tripartite tricarboxylate transporter substrate binding protein [Comamonadaceae bacterium]|nr:tripartite tricarboxylate transporter substrate binding protein [Comamonadaceae bacterium]